MKEAPSSTVQSPTTSSFLLYCMNCIARLNYLIGHSTRFHTFVTHKYQKIIWMHLSI
jgi:hypothetical protein